MTEQVLLRINIAPDLEEEFIDALLGNPLVTGYQCWPASGHGQVGAMTITEQVAGRRQRMLFEVVLPANQLEAALAQLKQTLPLADIIYWVLPVLGQGRFDA